MGESVTIINTRSDEVDPASLTLHPSNPRQGDVGLLVTLYQENGYYGRVVVDERTGYVLAGNHRVKAALALNMPLVPVEYVETRDDDHATAIMLADNRASDVATNDEVVLAELLEGLAKNGGLQGSGFDGDDLDELLQASEALPLFSTETEPPDFTEPLPESGVRQVLLFFNAETHPVFMDRARVLFKHYGVDNLTDAIFKAVEDAHAACKTDTV